MVDLGPNVGRHRPKFGRLQARHVRDRANFGRHRSNIWPSSTNFGQKLAEFGLTPSWLGTGEFGAMSDEFAQGPSSCGARGLACHNTNPHPSSFRSSQALDFHKTLVRRCLGQMQGQSACTVFQHFCSRWRETKHPDQPMKPRARKSPPCNAAQGEATRDRRSSNLVCWREAAMRNRQTSPTLSIRYACVFVASLGLQWVC